MVFRNISINSIAHKRAVELIITIGMEKNKL